MKLVALLSPLAVVVLLIHNTSSAPAAADVVKDDPTSAPTTSTAAPVPTPDHTHPPHTHAHTEDCKKGAGDVAIPPGTGEYYDQRQNGTHNIRVEIDNIVILHAPLDMGSASTEGDEEIAAFLTQLSQLAEAETANKDKPSTTTTVEGEEKPDKEKPAVVKTQKKTRNKVRLASLLAPLLRHNY